MFQEDRKNRFIEQYTVEDTRNTVLAMFRSLEPYEQRLDKDVAEFTTDELQEAVNGAFAVKTISRYPKLRYLQKYFRWCAMSGYPNVIADINGVSTAGLDKVRRQFTASPMHLQRCLDIAFAPVEDETVDIIYRCYLWLGYMEFPESRIIELTRDNVDFDAHKLVFDGRSYLLYQEAEPAFHKAAELTEFNYHHESPSYDIKRSRFMSNGLIRGIKGDFAPLTIRPKVNAKVREYGNSDTPIYQLSYKRLATSGMFYRVYSRERAGMDVFPLQEFYEVFADRGIQSKSAMTMAHAYVNDYERWKLAFSI